MDTRGASPRFSHYTLCGVVIALGVLRRALQHPQSRVTVLPPAERVKPAAQATAVQKVAKELLGFTFVDISLKTRLSHMNKPLVSEIQISFKPSSSTNRERPNPLF